MISIGIGLATTSASGSALDSATRSFVAASGATQTGAIDAWVRGLKTLGLWSNILTYPMRSGQNSSGTTVYSLGGLSTTNAAHSGTISVTAAGRVPATTSDVVNTTLLPSGTNGALVCVLDLVAIGSEAQRILTYDQPATTNGLGLDKAHATGFRRLGSSFTQGLGTQTTDPTMIAVGGGTSTFFAQDAAYTSAASVSLTASTAPLGILGRGVQGSVPATYAMSIYYAGALTSANYLALRSLYKNTLGAGFGLP